ncbi:hypothetical protein KVR01_012572 [Diaporthe batatas]|uniref:uncharacterized protein n=1 Tax=Diaporthe batatas TaxID=748121 RepID=UPI001D037616|nr:uncharacterized protein KVR01_012572 [Diaporthe batatas]KAG8157530.1 hypothetical protein KVR01_012572 [Diaporthe batatas]
MLRFITRRRGDGPVMIAGTGPVLVKHREPPTQSAGNSRYIGTDWRPAFEEKSRDLAYSSQVLQDQRSISNGMKMGEAYHGCAQDSRGPRDMYNTTAIGKGYYMKAMNPGADICASRVQEAQKERIETLSRGIRDGGQSGEGHVDELYLVRNWAAPLRGKYQQAAVWGQPEKQPGPAAEPMTYDEMDLDSPESPREDGSEDWHSDVSTLTSEIDAGHRDSEGEYVDPLQEEKQQEEEEEEDDDEEEEDELSRYSQDSLADLKQPGSEPARLEETRSRLEETKLGLSDGYEGDEAEPPESCLKKLQSSLLGLLRLSHGTRRQDRRRRPTAAEKGKWAARCACAGCQRRRGGSVRFDPSAMDKAEDGPGLSYEGFVKRMRDHRKTAMEADPVGEGCSSWAMEMESAGPGGLAEPVGQGMFTNPRPAPRLPVPMPLPLPVPVFVIGRRESARKTRINRRDISEPVQLEQTTWPMEPTGAGLEAAGGHTADETSRRKARGGLSKRLLRWW